MNAAVHDISRGDTPNQPEGVSHTWNADTMTAVDRHAALVADIKKQRKALNDEMAASKSNLVAIGMNAEALAAAQAYANSGDDERRNFDETYIFARRALGCPIQEDLFTAAMRDELTVETPPEK